MAETYGVSEVAAMAGVTVRTLHHYDEIGLLAPSTRSGAGYRQYGPDDLARLQNILFYRELGLGLDDIAVAIGEPDADRVAILEEQRRLLTVEARRLAAMVKSLTRAINAAKTGETMNAEEMFEVFGDFNPSEHEAEAEAKWPEVYEQSHQRTAGYGKQQWQAAVAEGEAIAAKLGALLVAGNAAGSQEAMDAAEEHRLSIDRWYYSCSSALHVGLAEMYLADARFRKYWEDRGEGLAQFVHDAIVANAARTDDAG